MLCICGAQSGADTLVGQSVVQMAKAAGITTVSIVPSCPDQETMISLLQVSSNLTQAFKLFVGRSKFTRYATETCCSYGPSIYGGLI